LGLEPEERWRIRHNQANSAEPVVIPVKVAGAEKAAPGEELVVSDLGALLQ